MKGKFEILMVIAVLCLPGVMSGETDPFLCRVDYTVALPMVDDDVRYQIYLSSASNPADSLLGTNYLIQWELPSADNTSGFTAYFDGHFYNFRETRLREYHFAWDSIPFLTRSGGIQRNAQFLNLFPFMLDYQLSDMQRDSTYTIGISSAVQDGIPVEKINVVRKIDDQEALQMEYIREKSTHNPLMLRQLYNPGMIGEQEVTAYYYYDHDVAPQAPATEDQLIEIYPDIFVKYRTSNFTVENLRGQQFPSFALLTTTRERYTYNKGDGFVAPTVIALIDPNVASAYDTLVSIRESASMVPRQINLIYAFIDNDTDKIESLTGLPHMSETLLTSSRSLARDTGANSYPTIFLVGKDGNVSDVILGYRNDLADLLLQKMSVLK